jgi:hypothetical protein
MCGIAQDRAGSQWPAGVAILGEMIKPRSHVSSRTVGRGLKKPPSHRVDVKILFAKPRPYGWQIYQQDGTSPVLQSPIGYASETDAWTAGGVVLDHIFRGLRKLG